MMSIKRFTLPAILILGCAAAACGADAERDDNGTVDTGMDDTTMDDTTMDDTTMDDTTMDDTSDDTVEADVAPDAEEDVAVDVVPDAEEDVAADVVDPDTGGDVTADVPADVTEGCGEVTFQGECDGSVVRYCADDTTLVEEDCAVDFGESFTCGYISEEFGNYCVLPAGDSCLIDLGEGAQPWFCAGTEPGCVIGAGGESACTENVGICDPAVEVAVCDGNLLVQACQQTQPFAIDCDALGGTCGEAQCSGLPVDAICVADLLNCAEGLTCNGEGVCAEPVP